MEDRRQQVFVSSTFLDLKDERAAVVSALLQMEAFPAGMELFPAADDDAWSLITRVIDSSDYYLLVVGGKYGSVDSESELSYTEKEFDYAVEQKKPVMAFLHGDPGQIPLDKSEIEEPARLKLEAFRAKVQASKHVKYWDGPENLKGQVALSFSDFRQRYPAVGWIRGDVEVSAEALSEINELRKQLADTEKTLANIRTEAPSGAEDLAQGNEPSQFVVDYSAAATLTGADEWRTPVIVGTFAATTTWDELFSRIGPELLDEADEAAMKKQIGQMLASRFLTEVEDGVRSWAEEEGKTVASVARVKVTMKPEEFGTLIIQLRALGLIEKSDRNRSVKDKGTYWKLTPHGDEHLTSLRAIRKSDAAAVAHTTDS